MITADERRKLEVSRNRLLEKQKQIKHEIEICEQEAAEAEILADRLSAVRRGCDDELQRFRTESANLKQQIEKATGEKKLFNFSFLSPERFAHSHGQEKVASLSQKIDDLAAKTESGRESEREMDLRIEVLEQYCGRLDRIAKKIPCAMRLILPVADLESERCALEENRLGVCAELGEIGVTRVRLEGSWRALSEAFVEVTKRAEALGSELESWESVLASKFADLRATSMLVHAADIELQKECAAVVEVQAEVARQREAFAQWETLQRAVESELEAEVTEMITPEVGGIELSKKKALIAQLEHKLGETRESLLRQRGEDPQLTDLNDKLMGEGDALLEAEKEYARGKQRIETLRSRLDLKERVIQDLGKWCPLGSKIKVRPGIDELLFVYDVALTRNRDMAAQLQVLRQEQAELEAERIALLGGRPEMCEFLSRCRYTNP
jgi:chromosome segregation ATPase